MKKIRICFALPGCYPLFKPEIQETFGGSEVELYNMAVYFSSRQDFQVEFLVGDYGQNPLETYRNIGLHKLKYMRPGVTRNPLHKVLKILCLIKTLLFQQSDIYITKTAGEMLGWLVLVCKWLRGKKVVFRLGSDRDTELPYWKARSLRLYSLYRLGLLNCDLILCQSEFQQAQLYKSCRLIGKVIKNVFYLEPGYTHVKDYVLWVSRCMALKRPLLFLELARRIPNEKFIMIMPVNRENKVYSDERITGLSRRIAEEAREIPNLTLIDFVPFEEIQSYYNHAKLFVNTSVFEGFPNSFIQACMGRTGILSLKVDPDGFISRNNLGLCCDDDFEAAVSFVQNLNAGMVYECGKNAFEYVSMNHDIQKIAPKYVRLFEKLVQRPDDGKENILRKEDLAAEINRLDWAFAGNDGNGIAVEYLMETDGKREDRETRNKGSLLCWNKDMKTTRNKDVKPDWNDATRSKDVNSAMNNGSHKKDGQPGWNREPKQTLNKGSIQKQNNDAEPLCKAAAYRPKKSRYAAVYRLKTMLGDRTNRGNRAL